MYMTISTTKHHLYMYIYLCSYVNAHILGSLKAIQARASEINATGIDIIAIRYIHTYI
jgi:hypothetical protein